MPYSVTYDAEAGLIAVNIQGKVDLSVMRGVASQAARLAKEHNCFLVLNDFREASITLSTLEIFDLPRKLSEFVAALGFPVSKFKRALVVAQDLGDASFFETVSQNRGQNVMIFRDMDAAKKWLLEK